MSEGPNTHKSFWPSLTLRVLSCPLQVLANHAAREKPRRPRRATHATLDGSATSCASALLAHFCIWQGEPPRHVGKWIEKIGGCWTRNRNGKVGLKGENSVRAAITALGHAAAMHVDYARDLPLSLLERLEDGDYGRKYLQQIDASPRARFA